MLFYNIALSRAAKVIMKLKRKPQEIIIMQNEINNEMDETIMMLQNSLGTGITNVKLIHLSPRQLYTANNLQA